VTKPAQSGAPSIRRLLQTVALVLILALASFWAPTLARADGDPASDVLVAESLFVAQDAALSQSQQAQLTGLIAEAARHGYPIRVALIASPADLGSITPLWRQPQAYASFLGEELSLIYHGPLLVVMPNGFGTYHVSDSALAGVNPAVGLEAAADVAVRKLAAAAGHPLSLPAATAPRASSRTADTVVWIAFALGAFLIAAAWTASFRARPLGGETTTSA
jgi:hypothetical protein